MKSQSFWESLMNAFNGFRHALRQERNVKIHFVATFVVVLSGLLFRLTLSEWSFIVIAIVMVWVAELLNTSIEGIADQVSPQYSPEVGHAKDVAAGAALIAALGAVIIGILVFGPRILYYLGGLTID
ncbi:MAG: diacylglycerol kinase family protein [Syntrophomonadaceae bacterium]|nr:diacylglycerol kinase family protein [Syntrophomonadaceae bacterium]